MGRYILRKFLRVMGFDLYRLSSGRSPRILPLVPPQMDRLLYLYRMYDRIKGVPGDVVECRVGTGATLLMFAHLMHAEPHQPRLLWGFDSFKGFPEPTPEDASPRNPKRGEWDIPKWEVIAFLEDSQIDPDFFSTSVRLIPGFFNESLLKFPNRPIALLHLDADLHQSYRDGLNLLFQKVAPGGIVLFDEYRVPNFPGATKAIDEYFANTSYRIQHDLRSGKHYVMW